MSISLSGAVELLVAEYGEAEWWPSESPFEVAVGAILTQRTSWDNVLMAVQNLRAAQRLTPEGILECDDAELEKLVRPSGFYRQKSRYLRDFSSHIVSNYDGEIDRMKDRPLDELREELLTLTGIGPETADTIMLYALCLPSFVVDAYSFRLLRRLQIYDGRDYGAVKRMFEELGHMDSRRMSIVHAAIVNHCKSRCRVRQICSGCPLTGVCPSEAHEDDE